MEENSFIFNFVGYGLGPKSLGVKCTFEEVAKKNKCQKLNMNIFTTKLWWIVSPSFYRAKSIKLLYSIIIFNTISLLYKPRPTKFIKPSIHKIQSFKIAKNRRWMCIHFWTCMKKIFYIWLFLFFFLNFFSFYVVNFYDSNYC